MTIFEARDWLRQAEETIILRDPPAWRDVALPGQSPAEVFQATELALEEELPGVLARWVYEGALPEWRDIRATLLETRFGWAADSAEKMAQWTAFDQTTPPGALPVVKDHPPGPLLEFLLIELWPNHGASEIHSRMEAGAPAIPRGAPTGDTGRN